jgi:hypothetical protein
MRRDLLLIALLFALSFLFFGDVLRPDGDEMIFGRDLFNLFHPVHDFAFSQVAAGELPLWNPYLFLGFPQYAEPQMSTFYPPLWLATFLPIGTVYALLYALHLGLSAAGGYMLVRVLGGKPPGALLAGFVLGFNAFMVSRLYGGQLSHLMTITYLPWLLAAVIWAIRERTWTATLLAAVPLGLAFLAGFAPFFPLLVGTLFLVMLVMAIQAWQQDGPLSSARVLLQILVLGLFASLLAAIQLLPTLEMARYSNRVAGASYEFASKMTLPLTSLVRILMPDLYGSPVADASYWAHTPFNGYWEFAIYVGVLPLLFYVLSWPYGKRKWRYWFVLGLFGLLVALGSAGVIHRILYTLVPGIGFFRMPARIAYLFVLAAAILTGLMFDYWFDLPDDIAMKARKFLPRVLVVGSIILLVLIVLSVFWQAVQTDPEQLSRTEGITGQLVRLLLLGVASLAVLIWGYRLGRWRLTIITLALLMIDLWGYGNKLVFLEKPEPELGWQMANLALPTDRNTYRVITEGLLKNKGYFYGFRHVDGFDDFRTDSGLQLAELAAWDVRLTRLLGVRYLLIGDEAQNPGTDVPGWQVLTEPAGVTIYDREDWEPQAFVVHDILEATDENDSLELISQPELDLTKTAVIQVMPGAHCSIEPRDRGVNRVDILSYEPHRVVLETEAPASAWLILSDLYYPGWNAFIDGNQVPIQPTNHGLRGVCLPGGLHQVVFEFQPRILIYGILLTGLALAVLIVTLAIWGMRRFTPARKK